MEVFQTFFNHTSDYTIGSLSSQMLSTRRVSPQMVTDRLQLITTHHQWHKWPPRTTTYLVLNGTCPIVYPPSCSCPFLPILMLYEYILNRFNYPVWVWGTNTPSYYYSIASTQLIWTQATPSLEQWPSASTTDSTNTRLRWYNARVLPWAPLILSSTAPP